VQQVVAEVGDALPCLLSRLEVDLVLELVDLGVDVVDEIEVPLRDVVDDPVQDHPGGVGRANDGPDRLDVVGLAPLGGRLAHGEDAVVREHDSDLLVVDAVLLGHRPREQEDPEDVVAVPLERRPRLVVVARVGDEQLDGGLLEVTRRRRPQRLRVGVQQVDPVRGHPAAIRRGCR
jgi:hypothetical protein